MQAAVDYPTAIDPAYLNSRQVASLLSVAERTVRYMSERGELPKPVRFGRAVRWHRDAVLQHLASRETTPSKGAE